MITFSPTWLTPTDYLHYFPQWLYNVHSVFIHFLKHILIWCWQTTDTVPSDALFMRSMFKVNDWWCCCNKLLLQLNIVPGLASVLAAFHVKEAAVDNIQIQGTGHMFYCVCMCVCVCKNRYNICITNTKVNALVHSCQKHLVLKLHFGFTMLHVNIGQSPCLDLAL